MFFSPTSTDGGFFSKVDVESDARMVSITGSSESTLRIKVNARELHRGIIVQAWVGGVPVAQDVDHRVLRILAKSIFYLVISLACPITEIF